MSSFWMGPCLFRPFLDGATRSFSTVSVHSLMGMEGIHNSLCYELFSGSVQIPTITGNRNSLLIGRGGARLNLAKQLVLTYNNVLHLSFSYQKRLLGFITFITWVFRPAHTTGILCSHNDREE